MIRYIGAIASSVISKKKKQKGNKHSNRTTHPINTCTKEQHLKWVKEGKCQSCGADSGEFKGICDDCRLS